jgi:hypothetical protein
MRTNGWRHRALVRRVVGEGEALQGDQRQGAADARRLKYSARVALGHLHLRRVVIEICAAIKIKEQSEVR